MNTRLTNIAIECIERGWLPDRWTRWGIRKLLVQRLTEVDLGDTRSNRLAVGEFVKQMQDGPIAPLPDLANEQHYEVPAEFFAEMLGPRKKYSSCLWHPETSSLAEAEEVSLAETCRHAELADGQHILELGCGWGSLTLWMAEHYPRARVTAVSNSQSQREFIEQQLQKRGWQDRVRVVTCDMNDFDAARLPQAELFDRVVSVEMFEHMRNYQRLLGRIANWLSSEGKLFVHIFCHRQCAYSFQRDGASDWMGRYFFSGGIMPSFDLLSHFSDQFSIEDQWSWSGVHYQRTLDAWLDQLDRHQGRALRVLSNVYGPQHARRWLHRWRIFLLACSELFGWNGGQEWFVGHYLLKPVSVHSETSRTPQTAGA